jgi:AraC-like DNA-binding protein
MTGIPLMRCQFLIPFAEVHGEVGASTEALLTKFRLPTSLEEKANHYVPILPAIRFAEAVQNLHGIADLGFQISRRLEFSHLSGKLQDVINNSPTLFVALQQLSRWAPLEDTNLNIWLERHNDHLRICSRLAQTAGLPHLEHSQWLQNVFTMYIVRRFAGPDWTPPTIAFEARYTPSLDTQAFWPNTQFLSGERASWIEVPVPYLSLPNPGTQRRSGPMEDEGGPTSNDMVGSLKMLLPAYLDERTPTVAEVAEMAGISSRSFQRKLTSLGLTYSALLAAVRFESAAELLRNTNAKIIDVAFCSGYTDPAHFTRAFRRMSGVTPREFRHTWRLNSYTPSRSP